MKLLLVDQFGEMGGAQRCLLEAAMGFRERGWDLHAAVPASGPFSSALVPFCAQVHSLVCGPFTSGRKSWSDTLRFARQVPAQAAQIARLARSQQPDVIYVNGPRVLPAAALARARRPLVYHAHWMPPQAAASRLARAALRWSRASAIVSSMLAAEWLQDSVEASRIFTVYNGVAGSAFTHSSEQVRRIAMLGRISPEKGQLEFAQAARIVSQQIRGLRFTICGAPMFSEESYFTAVRAQANGSVEFHAWTEDVPAFLAGVDLLVVPSAGIDNIPRVILEAFAASVPVLAFASGAIPELVEHGETGLLVRERTAEALAQAILVAVAQPDRLADIAARAHARWRERYTLRRFQSEICDAVEAVSRRRHQRNPLKSAGANAPA
jgi:glycosyltransferase involved in cell wall biosynthesis